jgi:flagellar hook-length control protein FliK
MHQAPISSLPLNPLLTLLTSAGLNQDACASPEAMTDFAETLSVQLQDYLQQLNPDSAAPSTTLTETQNTLLAALQAHMQGQTFAVDGEPLPLAEALQTLTSLTTGVTDPSAVLTSQLANDLSREQMPHSLELDLQSVTQQSKDQVLDLAMQWLAQSLIAANPTAGQSSTLNQVANTQNDAILNPELDTATIATGLQALFNALLSYHNGQSGDLSTQDDLSSASATPETVWMSLSTWLQGIEPTDDQAITLNDGQRLLDGLERPISLEAQSETVGQAWTHLLSWLQEYDEVDSSASATLSANDALQLLNQAFSVLTVQERQALAAWTSQSSQLASATPSTGQLQADGTPWLALAQQVQALLTAQQSGGSQVQSLAASGSTQYEITGQTPPVSLMTQGSHHTDPQVLSTQTTQSSYTAAPIVTAIDKNLNHNVSEPRVTAQSVAGRSSIHSSSVLTESIIQTPITRPSSTEASGQQPSGATYQQPLVSSVSAGQLVTDSLPLGRDSIQHAEKLEINLQTPSNQDDAKQRIDRMDFVVMKSASPTPSSSATPSPFRAPLDVARLFVPEGQMHFAEQVRLLAQAREGTVQVKLNPPSLGVLEVRIAVEGDKTTVHFVSQNAVVRDVLETNMPRLREALAQDGLSLDDTDVSDQFPRDQQRGEATEAFTSQHDPADNALDHELTAEPDPTLTSSTLSILRGRLDLFA